MENQRLKEKEGGKRQTEKETMRVLNNKLLFFENKKYLQIVVNGVRMLAELSCHHFGQWIFYCRWDMGVQIRSGRVRGAQQE